MRSQVKGRRERQSSKANSSAFCKNTVRCTTSSENNTALPHHEELSTLRKQGKILGGCSRSTIVVVVVSLRFQLNLYVVRVQGKVVPCRHFHGRLHRYPCRHDALPWYVVRRMPGDQSYMHEVRYTVRGRQLVLVAFVSPAVSYLQKVLDACMCRNRVRRLRAVHLLHEDETFHARHCLGSTKKCHWQRM